MANFNAESFVAGSESIGYAVAGAIVAGHQARAADRADAALVRAQTARIRSARLAREAEAASRRASAALADERRAEILRRAVLARLARA